MSNLSSVAAAYKNKRMNITLGIDYGPRISRAEEANRLSTPRTIKLEGAVQGEGIFDGTSDVTIFTEGNTVGDYATLANKPKINDVELIGNKTSEDLNIQDKYEYEPITNNEIDDIIGSGNENYVPITNEEIDGIIDDG